MKIKVLPLAHFPSFTLFPGLSTTTQDSGTGHPRTGLWVSPADLQSLVTGTHLAGVYAALCDEEGTGPLQGPVQFLESRVDLLIQESDTFFEEGLLVWGQHGNDSVYERRLAAGGTGSAGLSSIPGDLVETSESSQDYSVLRKLWPIMETLYTLCCPHMVIANHMWLWGT